MIKIDDNLNLVLPVVTEEVTEKVNGKDVAKSIARVQAFHTPISRSVFDANFRLLAATKSAIASKGAHYLMSAGPRIAGLTLRDEALRDAESRGRFDEKGNPKDESSDAFLSEIKRLTMILGPGSTGWEMMPVDSAISSGMIDEEDWREAESSIIFFCCHVAMAKKSNRQGMAKATASVLDGSTTSLSSTAFTASLQTSTKTTDIPSQESSQQPSDTSLATALPI